MRQLFVAAAAGVLALAALGLSAPQPAGAEAAPAQARTASAARCIYLVKGLKAANGMYLGQFTVLRKTGTKVAGYGGAFYSEGYNIRGNVVGTSARLSTEDPYRPGRWTRINQKWVPAQNRLVGWRSVTKTQMSKYSGGYVPVRGRTCG